MQTSHNETPQTKLLRASQVAELTTLSRMQVMIMARDGDFPKPVALSKKRRAWRESDVIAWIESRKVVG